MTNLKKIAEDGPDKIEGTLVCLPSEIQMKFPGCFEEMA